MGERGQIIGQALKSGIYGLSNIKTYYNNYSDGGYVLKDNPRPRKQYIGGTRDQARERAAALIPGLQDSINSIANTYNIDRNVLYNRVLKEGIIDSSIKEFNSLPPEQQTDYFWNTRFSRPSNTFNDLGLDDAGTHIENGTIKLRRNIDYTPVEGINKKNRKVKSIKTNTVWDGLHIMGAEFEQRKNKLKQRGLPNNGTYQNASYNLGVYHKDLNNADYINNTYRVKDYFKNYNDDPIVRNSKSTIINWLPNILE